jgi:hypothetical protein
VCIFAVDWSGAVQHAGRKIWLAEAKDGRLLYLANGRDRQQLAQHLTTLAVANPDLIVGLDFAFSCPGSSSSVGIGDVAARKRAAQPASSD